MKLLTEYYNAIDWHNYWLELGDELYGTYMFNRVDMKRAAYPDWWSRSSTTRRAGRLKNPPSNNSPFSPHPSAQVGASIYFSHGRLL